MKALSSLKVSYKLLNLDVKIYTMRSRDDKISFSSLSSCCKSATKLKRNCDNCKKELAWRTDLKGYKIAKDSFVELTKAELDTIDKVDNGIEILYFVKVSDIPMTILDKPYFLEAQNSISNKLYNLFSEILSLKSLVAVCRTTIKGTEHFSIIRHDKKGLIMQYIEKTTDLMIDVKKLESNKDELEQMKEIIDDDVKEFDFDGLKPIYIEKVKQLIEQKADGKTIEVKSVNSETITDTKLIDTLALMKPKKKEIKLKKEIIKIQKEGTKMFDELEKLEGGK